DWDHLAAHDRNGGGDFAHRLALDPHAHQERADLRGGRPALHDDLHHLAHFGAGQVPAVGEPVERPFDVHCRRPFARLQATRAALNSAAILRKFCTMACPFSDAMLSGWNCTPWIGRSRCCRPMIWPSSERAVTVSTSGKLSSRTTSE